MSADDIRFADPRKAGPEMAGHLADTLREYAAREDDTVAVAYAESIACGLSASS
jgi:hypothetical protein